MAKHKRKKRKSSNTKPATQRLFYRWPPSLDFLWTAPSLVLSVLIFAGIVVAHHLLAAL